MFTQTQILELNKIAKQMVASGKGILAADESMPTVGKRFASINLENTEDNRRAFRKMLLTVPGMGQYISGVILFDETIRQKVGTGLDPSLPDKTFVEVLQAEGILPGIKVDQGLSDFGSNGEKTTKGLEGLKERLEEYVKMGAKFTKWRSVITISDTPSLLVTPSPQPSPRGGGGSVEAPTEENIRQNAKDLAQYALIAQQAGLVPMVEPEVLLDGDHNIESAKAASTRILQAMFEELKNAGVAIEGVIVKTSMVLPGKKSAKATPQEIAKETLDVFNRVIPRELPGVVFLSGGQGDIEATENLNAINQFANHPHPSPLPGGEGNNNALSASSWPLTFSYARALQDAATKIWAGKKENMEMAQSAFLHRAKMNSLASLGKYQSTMEKEFKPTEASVGQN